MKNHLYIKILLITMFSLMCFFVVNDRVEAFDKTDLNGAFSEYNASKCDQQYTKQCRYSLTSTTGTGMSQSELAESVNFTINFNSNDICMTATYDGTTVPVQNAIAFFTVDDLNGKCPNVLYANVNSDGTRSSFMIHGMDNNDTWTKYGRVIYFDDSNSGVISGDDSIKNSESLIFIKNAYSVIRFLVPVLIIVFSIIDFVGVVISGENEKMEKAKKNFVIRILIGIAFIFIPIIVEILLKLAGILKSDESLANIVYDIIN